MQIQSFRQLAANNSPLIQKRFSSQFQANLPGTNPLATQANTPTPNYHMPFIQPQLNHSGVRFGDFEFNVENGGVVDMTPITFQDYYKMSMSDPRITRTPFQRVIDMIDESGVSETTAFGKKAYSYNFFTRPDEPELSIIGNERQVDDIVRYFREAAEGQDTRKKLLVLWGPAGGAKTTLIRRLMEGYEQYSRTDAGKMYTFQWKNLPKSLLDKLPKGVVHDGVVADDLNSDPLWLIPKVARSGKEREISRNMELPPLSRWIRQALMTEYEQEIHSANPTLGPAEVKNMALRQLLDNNVEVYRFIVSHDDRKGIGNFKAQSQKSVDESQLWGSVNLRNLSIIGDESDPRVFSLRGGAFFDANRGIGFHNEALKLLPDSRDVFTQYLEVAAERRVTPPKLPAINVEEINIIDANPAEKQIMEKDAFLRPLQNRLQQIRMPYLLEYNKEAQVYENNIGIPARRAGKFVAPHTFEAAALWAVLTRMGAPGPDKEDPVGLLKKAYAYAGKPVDVTAAEIDDYIREGYEADDGLSGLSSRDIQFILSRASSEHDVRRTQTLDAPTVFKVVDEVLSRNLLEIKDKKLRDRLQLRFEIAKAAIGKAISDDVNVALAQNKDELNRCYEAYVENCHGFINGQRYNDQLLKEVEQYLPAGAVSDARTWRQSIVNKASAYHNHQKPYNYDNNGDDKLRVAVSKYVRAHNTPNKLELDSLRLKLRDPDKWDKARQSPVLRVLMELGYNEVSALHALDVYSDLENEDKK